MQALALRLLGRGHARQLAPRRIRGLGVDELLDDHRAVLAEHRHHLSVTRPLAPPYSLHTVLLKVESYNDPITDVGRPGEAQVERELRCYDAHGGA